MSKPLWTETVTCRSGRACCSCRRNRVFRERLASGFELPGGEVDFPCPHGQPWPEEGQIQPVPLTVRRAAKGALGVARAVTGTGGASKELVAARTAICTGCVYAVKKGGVFTYCSLCKCSTWAKVRNEKEQCPAGKW